MFYLGVDVGSVSTDIVLMDKDYNVECGLYLKTKGKPINVIQEGFKLLKEKYNGCEIAAAGTTGSGRQIAAYMIGSDVVKNEITAHAIAALQIDKNVGP